jgi:hypothetical protein
MIHVYQFLNGYGIIVIWGVVVSATFLLLICRRSRKRWWTAWTTAVAATFTGLFLLRTADTTVIAAVPTDAGGESGMIPTLNYVEWDSAESIEKTVLASDGKPTLVEFYTDFGIG